MNNKVLSYLLLCLVLVAFGVTPVLSFATIGLLILFRYAVVSFGGFTQGLIVAGLLSVSMLMAIFDLMPVRYTLGFAQIRLILLFAVLFILMSARSRDPVDVTWLNHTTKNILMLFLGVVLIQYSLSVFNVHVYVPEWVLAQKGSGTVYDEDVISRGIDLELLRFRPSFLYSEPSYLSLIVLAIFMINVVSSRAAHEIHVPYLLGLGTAILSQSMYGVFGLTIIYLLILLLVSNVSRLKILLGVFVFVSLSGFFLGEMMQRLLAILSGDDFSLLVRLILPFEVLATIVNDVSVFGFPISQTYQSLLDADVLSYYLDPPFHNGLLNIFINSGVLAFPVIVIFFMGVRSPIVFAFFLLALMQNGSFGSWDKCFIIGLVGFLANSVRLSRIRGALLTT
jgi:hypothetical protein